MKSGIVLLCLASFTLSAESQCSNVIVSPVIGTTLDTGSGQFHLSPFVLGPDTPTLYTDFDTLVNFTQGSGWTEFIFEENNQPACAEKVPPQSPPPPQPSSIPASVSQSLPPPPSVPQRPPPFPRPPPNAPIDVGDLEGLQALADSLRDQAEDKRSEAQEARSLATTKREEANVKREDADLKASEAETKTNAAQASRDDFMETIADDITRQKAGTLIDAAIAGVAVTKVVAKLAAVDETSACVTLFANMQLDASSGVCDVRPSLRRKLLDTTFNVDVILSHVSVEKDTINSAINALTAAGVETSITEEEPFALLYSITGLDETTLSSLETKATAAAAAKSEAEAAEAVALAAETDATASELSAITLEAEAANLEAEVADLEAQIIAVEERPPRDETSSSMMTVVTALIAAGIVGPGTVFSVMALCFKPLLRRKLLQCGFRRLADIVVPDVKSDVKLMSVKMNELEAFVSKQKLPRFLDITPEIEASEIEVDDKNVLGVGGYGAVFQASYNGAPVAVKALLGIDNKMTSPANVVKMMRREATIMCSLNHPNIIRVHGIVPARGWIVMELCEGGALDDYIRDTEEMIHAK